MSFPRPVGQNIYISIVTWHHLVSGKLTLEADLRGNEGSTGKNMKMPVNSHANIKPATSAFDAFILIKQLLRGYCFSPVSQRSAFLFKHKCKVVVLGAQTCVLFCGKYLAACECTGKETEKQKEEK